MCQHTHPPFDALFFFRINQPLPIQKAFTTSKDSYLSSSTVLSKSSAPHYHSTSWRHPTTTPLISLTSALIPTLFRIQSPSFRIGVLRWSDSSSPHTSCSTSTPICCVRKLPGVTDPAGKLVMGRRVWVWILRKRCWLLGFRGWWPKKGGTWGGKLWGREDWRLDRYE